MACIATAATPSTPAAFAPGKASLACIAGVAVVNLVRHAACKLSISGEANQLKQHFVHNIWHPTPACKVTCGSCGCALQLISHRHTVQFAPSRAPPVLETPVRLSVSCSQCSMQHPFYVTCILVSGVLSATMLEHQRRDRMSSASLAQT